MEDFQTIEITPMEWHVRFKETGIDGKTFDASMVAIRCLNDVVQIHLAQSNKRSNFFKLARESKEFFRSLGFKHYEYTHNGRFVREDL